MLPLAVIALFLLAGTSTAEVFTNEFLVRMRQPTERHVADRVALRNGFLNLGPGRNGLGNIYVWASGDGGEEDDCNCDGYAASMWTISINSAINDGQNAHYDESCSSTLASTFSNGAKDPGEIFST